MNCEFKIGDLVQRKNNKKIYIVVSEPYTTFLYEDMGGPFKNAKWLCVDLWSIKDMFFYQARSVYGLEKI